MRLELPDQALPTTIALHEEGNLSDDDYFDFCAANPDLRLERTAQGEIIILPPAGLESSGRNNNTCFQLTAWARRTGAGKVFDSSAQFFLANGAARSPDASWISTERLSALHKNEKRKFPHLCPEFVIEVMLPSDRVKAAQTKIEEWMANGVQLAWLIDGDKRTVYVYRPGHPAEKKSGINDLAGEGPVAGFLLELEEIWAGL